MTITEPGPLAVSLGDPAGVGPELVAKAWVQRHEAGLPPFFVVGGARLLAEVSRALHLDVPIIPIARPQDARLGFAQGLPVLGSLDCACQPGQPSPAGAALALASLQEATRLAVSGAAGGVVTCPIAKARLAEVGFAFPGQTEFLAEACGLAPGEVVMMLAGPQLRTVPVTIHVSLADVPGVLTRKAIERKGRITAAALTRDFGLANPRLAVAALNPHAGEEGRMGDQEGSIIAPAIAALRQMGIAATGPFAADALFSPHVRGSFDVAICMYHDQALIPVKALDFDAAVNVTLGLPIVRTSPDHGTAFGIAGTGAANPGATIAAIRMAGACAARRAKHG